MKDVRQMTQQELAIEHVRLNKRIASDSKQSWQERNKAKFKVDNMQEYMNKIRELYR